MGKRSKGYRSKTRSLMRKKPRSAGKIGVSHILREYEPDDKVRININPSYHKGMPHRRYHGKIGVIRSRRGRSYIVEVALGKIKKNIIVHPIHFTHVGK